MANFFSGGLANALSEGIDKADQTRLAYAMMQKKMELDIQEKQAEQENSLKLQQQYQPDIMGSTEAAKLGAQSASQNIPPEEFQAISRFASDADTALSSGKPIPSLDNYEIKSTAGQQAALKAQEQVMTSRGLASQSKIFQPQRVQTQPDANGVVTQGFQIPATGTWMGQPVRSLEKTSHDALNKQDAGIQGAISKLQDINSRLTKVLPNSPAGVPINRLSAKLQSIYPNDPDLKTFIDQQGANALSYARLAQGSVPRNSELVKMDLSAISGINDDVPTALAKNNQLIKNLNSVMLQGHMVYDPTNVLKPSYLPDYTQQSINSQSNVSPNGPTPEDHFNAGVQAANDAHVKSYLSNLQARFGKNGN